MKELSLINRESHTFWLYELTLSNYGEKGIAIVANGPADEAINAWINDCKAPIGLSMQAQESYVESFIERIELGIGSSTGAFAYSLKSFEEISVTTHFTLFQSILRERLAINAPMESYWLGILEFAN